MCLAVLLAASGCTTTNNGSPDGGSEPGDDGGTASPDASEGTDAASEGGSSSGGSSDGGVEAGMPDSGSPDTGVADSGSPDAATADAGSPIIVVAPNGPTPPTTLPVVMLNSNTACTISSPTVWTAGVYVVDCSNYLEVDSVLTINQGTVVKFAAGNHFNVSATGTVNASGGSSSPIVFTSLKDDAHGGDTNGDGTATSPAPGDWSGVLLQGTNNSTFNQCGFYYSGGNDNGALVNSGPGTVSTTSNVFAHNKPTTDAITSSPALDLTRSPAGTVVNGNVFYDNRVPLGIGPVFSLDDTNSFDNSAAAPSQPQPNEYNGIVVNTGPDLVGHISWTATKVPIVLPSSYFVVEPTATLTLGDGVTVKSGPGVYLSIQGLISSKASSRGIVFTSLKDDAHGGDTNGDGSATSPGPGDWNGVQLANTAGSSFNATGFYYAGGGDNAALWGGGTSVSVTNCTFGHDQTTTDAITARGALDVSSTTGGTVVTGNVFYDDRVPLAIPDTLSIDDSNSFDNSKANPSSPQPSEYNGIAVNVGPDINGKTSWSATKVPFVIPPNLIIEGTGTLTLGNNVTLKFYVAGNSGIVVQSGGVISGGTGDILTSIRDDAHGGDTNGDGTATSPAAGDWWGISGPGTSGIGSTSTPLTCTTVGTEYYSVCN